MVETKKAILDRLPDGFVWVAGVSIATYALAQEAGWGGERGPWLAACASGGLALAYSLVQGLVAGLTNQRDAARDAAVEKSFDKIGKQLEELMTLRAQDRRDMVALSAKVEQAIDLRPLLERLGARVGDGDGGD